MERIARFDVTTGTTLERAAQAVAGDAGWHMDGHGAVYCDEKAYIGASLTEVAEALTKPDATWCLCQPGPAPG